MAAGTRPHKRAGTAGEAAGQRRLWRASLPAPSTPERTAFTAWVAAASTAPDPCAGASAMARSGTTSSAAEKCGILKPLSVPRGAKAAHDRGLRFCGRLAGSREERGTRAGGSRLRDTLSCALRPPTRRQSPSRPRPSQSGACCPGKCRPWSGCCAHRRPHPQRPPPRPGKRLGRAPCAEGSRWSR